MKSHKTRHGLLALGLATCLLCFPAALQSQCNVASTLTQMAMASDTTVYKILSAAAFCQSTAMNAVFCSPTAGGNTTTFLLANAMSMTVNPYCHWDCGCGTGSPPDIVIDGNDGLPVELMDFSVEG